MSRGGRSEEEVEEDKREVEGLASGGREEGKNELQDQYGQGEKRRQASGDDAREFGQ